MITSAKLPVSLPGLSAARWTSNELCRGVKDYYAVGRFESGRVEWRGGNRVWQSGPGSVQVKQPGDVHWDVARDGVCVWTAVNLSEDDVALARGDGKAVALPQLDPGDARAAPFHRLLDAIDARADRLTLEVTLAEAVSALAAIGRAHDPGLTKPVRRAMEYLRERIADSITLDDLAAYAGLDKFHLCRAFRAQIGLPPHAYLTRLRISRAKVLLAGGTRASEVAPLVGFYDQSQLTRHFRRIVGTTPGRFAARTSPALPG